MQSPENCRVQSVPLFASCGQNAHVPAGIVARNATLAPPELMFACDRPTRDLAALFTPQLIAQLRTLHAGVALSIEDFSAQRAALIRQLDAAGIPMTAWLVLPRAQGYCVNARNAPESTRCFGEFDQWSRQNACIFV